MGEQTLRAVALLDALFEMRTAARGECARALGSSSRRPPLPSPAPHTLLERTPSVLCVSLPLHTRHVSVRTPGISLALGAYTTAQGRKMARSRVSRDKG